MKLSHIVAMTEAGVIGRGGTLPWHIPEDFQIFKRTTMGHPMIMGRKTFDSIGRPLPGRTTIVVTRQTAWSPPPGVIVCHGVSEALARAADAPGGSGDGGGETFIIGGAELFRATMDQTDVIYRSVVHQVFAGDTHYPDLPAGIFERTHAEKVSAAIPFTWEIWRRIQGR